MDVRRGEARRPLLDEEAADLAVVGARPDDGDVGDRAVRDPHLRAVEDPVRAVATRVVRIVPGSEPASGSVSPKQPIASPRCIAGSQRSFCSSEPQRQIAYIASEPCTETRLRTPCRRPRARGTRARRRRRSPRQAVALEVHPEEPEPRDLLHELPRQDPLLEPVADLRHHALADELPDGVADLPLLVVEQRVEREEVERVECGRCGCGGCHVDSWGPGCLIVERRPRRRGPAMMPRWAMGG